MNAYYHYHNGKYVSLRFDGPKNDHWPERSLSAKGMTAKNLFLSRPMTPEEKLFCQQSRRYIRYKYYSWAGLIEDETASNVPPEFIEKLEQYSQNHPLSNQPELERATNG